MRSGHFNNRAMFWRIIRRLLAANRSRLLVVLLALGAGTTITAALLNLQVDAKRRLTAEFRSFGANVTIAPRRAAADTSNQQTLPETLVNLAFGSWEGSATVAAPFLYAVAEISSGDNPPVKAVVVGTTAVGVNATAPTWEFAASPSEWNGSNCIVGSAVASNLRLSGTPQLHLRADGKEIGCQAVITPATGGPEDNEVFANLQSVQNLTSSSGRISLIQVYVPGPPEAVNRYVAAVQKQIPDAEVRPIRQFTEAEAKIYNRISGLLTATVALVLILTALCVMAAMTNVAMERKNDVGLMKAIGGATRRVLRIFLAEAALLGVLGGVLGAAAGILLSIWLGKTVFGIAARPRLIVYPVAVGLTILVAIAGAYPLKRLASIRPASVFRGEA